MWLLAPESLLNLGVVKAADYTPGLMLKILHFFHSVYSRPLIHLLSWSWISCTRFLGWTFLQVLDQCSRVPKITVTTCPCGKNSNFFRIHFFKIFWQHCFSKIKFVYAMMNCFCCFWAENVEVLFFMTPSWSLFSQNHRIFLIYSLFW